VRFPVGGDRIAFSAMMMAGSTASEQDPSGRPDGQNLYDLEPRKRRRFRTRARRSTRRSTISTAIASS
jgi:hypothetical protein